MPLVRRRPLMRAAVVGGVAYHAGKTRANAQANEAAQDQAIAELQAQQAAPAPSPAAPAASDTDDMVARLTKLKGLLDSGVLTQEEFDAQKQKILAAG